MGRVYSYETIESGQVPTVTDFDKATLAFVSSVKDALETGLVDGAFIFGSVAVGSPNCRSDFDAVIALTTEDSESYRAASRMNAVIEESVDNKIIINPIKQSRASFSNGRHEIDRLFGQHLSSAYRLVIGHDPANYTQYPADSPRDILAGYVSNKKRRLTEAYDAPALDFRDGSGVQRLLELPAAVGRKILQVLAETGDIDEAVKKSADKPAVVKASKAVLESTGLERGLHELLSLDDLYWDLLMSTMEGKVPKSEYEEEIRGLHEHIPEAIVWLDALAIRFCGGRKLTFPTKLT
jgi:hypothetical protein